jgi:hypothetical protein
MFGMAANKPSLSVERFGDSAADARVCPSFTQRMNAPIEARNIEAQGRIK